MSLPRMELPGGLSCSILGLGTMGFGGRYERDETNDADAVRIVHRALDLGVNLFDTAEVYAAGHCEEVLGTALQGRRGGAVIATKFSPSNGTKQRMIAACEASLKRLGTDVIDLYQMHWPNPAVSLEETVAGFEHLVKSGKVRAVGFSNATAALMQKTASMLPAGFPIATAQQEYSLAERFVERAVLPFCRKHFMGMLAYSPLAQGKLMQGESGENLAAIASVHGTTPAALALQWLRHQANVIPIPMTSKISHLESNVAALEKPLPAEAIADIGRAFPVTIADLPVTSIRVVASHTGKMYQSLEDARLNSLNISPSPLEIARELKDGEMLKPVKVRTKPGTDGSYELFEGQLRYWAWRLAHQDQLPIPAQIC